MAHLAVGNSLPDLKENLLSRVKEMEREQRLDDLIDEFKKDNVSKTLPYIWRQRLLWNVVNRLDYEAGTFLALYNALYRLGDPCKCLRFFFNDRVCISIWSRYLRHTLHCAHQVT